MKNGSIKILLGKQFCLDLIWICELCNHATHYGRTNQLEIQYPGLRETVINHMIRVNRLPRKAIEQLISKEFVKWGHRSGLTWKLSISARVLRKYPTLEHIDFAGT